MFTKQGHHFRWSVLYCVPEDRDVVAIHRGNIRLVLEQEFGALQIAWFSPKIIRHFRIQGVQINSPGSNLIQELLGIGQTVPSGSEHGSIKFRRKIIPGFQFGRNAGILALDDFCQDLGNCRRGGATAMTAGIQGVKIRIQQIEPPTICGGQMQWCLASVQPAIHIGTRVDQDARR